MKSAKPTCPAWVLDQLHRQGLPPRGRDQHQFSTSGYATPYWHGTCGQPVVTGTAWPWDVMLDPTPTTPEGELFAVLSGRVSVQVSRRDLWRRGLADIALVDANAVVVLIEHSCTGPAAIPNHRWAPGHIRVPVDPPF